MSLPLEFRISSNLKNIIGNELITDDLIAIFELVKNSYDARSKKVDIIFENIKNNQVSKIYIRDDGKGMTYNEIKDNWLFVGFSEKKEFEKELKNLDFRDKANIRKMFAGAKGIGRFSCDRLGEKLVLYSKTKKEEIIHKLFVDWNKFDENTKEEFQSIKVEYEKMSHISNKEISFPENQGVVLEIYGLKSDWDFKKLQKLKRKLQQLINPSYVSPELDFTINIIAKEFLEEDNNIKETYPKKNKSDQIDLDIVNGQVKNFIFEKLNIKTTQLYCTIDPEGKKITTELQDKGTFIYKVEEDNSYSKLYNINVIIYYLNKSAKSAFTSLMGLEPVKFGSVFLYKNGFKINPYGNEGDDWLGLELRRGQGYARYLSARDLMGRIEVLGYQPNIAEVSSRDGGVYKSQEFEELKLFFKEISLKRLENYVVEAIDWDSPSEKRPQKDENEIKKDSLKLISSLIGKDEKYSKNIEFNKDLLNIYVDKEIEKAPEILDTLFSLQNIIKGEDYSDKINLNIKNVRNAFKNLMQKQKELEKEVELQEKQAIFLKNIMGKEKEEVTGIQHQIGLSTTIIKNIIKDLRNKLLSNDKITKDYLIEFIDNLNYQIQIMSSISILATQAKYDLKSSRIEKDLIEFIKQYIENVYKDYYQDRLKNINIQISNKNNERFVKTFSPLEYVIIIDNLISNSIKAKATKIEIDFEIKNNKDCLITYRDNGIGLDPKYIEKLFQFGFSLTGGSGIGLYQIKKILNEDKGDISINTKTKEGIEFLIKVEK